MKVGRSGRTTLSERQEGSALILVLCACLVVAATIQALCAVAVCAERAVTDESVGRWRLGEKDNGLGMLRQRALESWGPIELQDLGGGANAPKARVEEIPDSFGWAMKATVRQNPSVSRQTVSAWMERGRDGIDLPVATAVAGQITASPSRAIPWIESEGATPSNEGEYDASTAAVGYILEPAVFPLLGPGCILADLTEPWRLDPGWAWLFAGMPPGESGAATHGGAAIAQSVSIGSGAVTIEGSSGGWEKLPEKCGETTADSPSLVVVAGGATLDARALGDFYGVIVVDKGSLCLDGTTVHGALFATGRIDLGDTGRLVYSPSILRWATDRSLNRVRLVPGSRRESVE